MTTIYKVVFSVKASFSAFEIRFVLGCDFSKNNPRGCKQQPRGFIVGVRDAFRECPAPSWLWQLS